MKMKLNQEDENRIFIKNKIVKHRWILLLYKNSDKKEERNSKERDSLGIYSTLIGSLLIFKIMWSFGMLSNEIMKKIKKF